MCIISLIQPAPDFIENSSPRCFPRVVQSLLPPWQGLWGTVSGFQLFFAHMCFFFSSELSFFLPRDSKMMTMVVHVLFRFAEHMMLAYAQVDCSIVNLAVQTLLASTYTLTGWSWYTYETYDGASMAQHLSTVLRVEKPVAETAFFHDENCIAYTMVDFLSSSWCHSFWHL